MSKSKPKILGNEPIRPGEFDDTMTSAYDCMDLWAAKLLTYMSDALRERRTVGGLDVRVARGWFGTSDFRDTCYCAGLDPAVVLSSYRQRLQLALNGDHKAALAGIAQTWNMNK